MAHLLTFLWLWLFLAFSAFADPAHEEKKLDVLTSLGLVRGFRHRLQQPAAENGDGQEIGVFFGIPFARPPVGKLRFEKPQPPSKWRGVRAADKQKSACIYHAWPEGFGKKSYSEDCLYLNIFAPIQNNNSNHSTVHSSLFPVLVIIHGGGFEVGSSHTYNNYEDIGAKFVSRGILVVAFDYRLGWMGFGSTGTEAMPGNLGLWDQLAALQFIRANIRAFGGDPEQITLYGYSAGSASVSLLSISPLSRDLFSRAIQMSGSPMASWALNERSVNETLVLARELGCPSGGSIKQCLTERPIAEIWSAVDRIGPTRYEDVNFAKWSPRVDGDFLPADVPQLLHQARPKPTLMGFVELESLCWTLFTGVNSTLAAFAVPWAQLALYDRARFEHSVSALVAKPEFFGDLAGEVRDAIVEQYVKEDLLAEFCALHQLPMGQYYLQRYTQMLSDLNFIVPILAELEQRTLLGWPIHFYMNVHYNRLEFPGPVKVHQNFHTNDENFLFRESHFPFTFEFSDDDRQVEGHLVQIVANFAKFGNPSPHSPLDVSPGVEWLPTSAQWPTQHLRIMPAPKLEQQMEADVLDRFQFWRGFVQKYGHRWNPVRGARGPGKSPARTE